MTTRIRRSIARVAVASAPVVVLIATAAPRVKW